MSVTLNMMEYPSDALIQAAYVTSGGFTTDCSGETTWVATNEVQGADDNMVDNNTGTYWGADANGQNNKGDFGVGVTKRVVRLRIFCADSIGCVKEFRLQGSNNDSDWDTLIDDATTKHNGTWEDPFDVASPDYYRYYRIIVDLNWGGTSVWGVWEIELFEQALECFSEDTIKEQGSYSLKGIALATDALNETLTRTVDPTIDLTGEVFGQFRIRSSRTGSNLKIGIHDSGGVTTETTPNIISANTWQIVEFGLPATVNKDAIDQIIITIINADSDNTFYLDWFITTSTITFEESIGLLESLPTIDRGLTMEEAIALNETITNIPISADVVLQESLALAEKFTAADQAIVLVEPSTEFLAEQAKRSNTPAKRIWLYINNTLYDITDKFMSMGPIDRKMTYKPGETKLLTISDQDLVMTNADRYFSDLDESSPFYDRNYAGADQIKVYAGFIIPSTGYAEVLQKADMKLIAIELMTKEAHAHLMCQDSFREVFDNYVGMPDSEGVADPEVYDGWRFQDIIEDLLVVEAGIGYADLVTDKGIEEWTGDNPDNYTEYGEAGGTRDIVKETTNKHWGTNALELKATTNDGATDFGVFQEVTCTTDVEYEFEAWVYYKVRGAGHVRLRVYNATDGDMAVSTIAVANTGYVRYRDTFIPTEATNNLYLELMDETTGEAYFDDISIRRVKTRIDIEDVELEFASLSFTKQTVAQCIQKLSEVARGNTVVLGDGTIQFRRFISEVTSVDLIIQEGVNYSRLRYVGQDFKLKINKVVVIGAGAAYAEAEIVSDTGVTLKYENDAILDDDTAGKVAAECLGRFAVHPALVEVTGEYLPSLDLKSVVKVYEPNSAMNPKIFQIRELALDIVHHKTRLILSIPDSAGRSKTWTTTTDFDTGPYAVLTDVLAVDNELRLKEPNSTGNAVYIFDMSGA